MLYYYYPEKLADRRTLGQAIGRNLVACEQFEAYSNQQRGRDYYVREKETLSEAFAYLDKLSQEGLLSVPVMHALRTTRRKEPSMAFSRRPAADR